MSDVKLDLEAGLNQLDAEKDVICEDHRSAIKRILKALCGVKKEKTYSIGDWFMGKDGEHLLVQVSYGRVCLIEVSNGNRRNDPIEVDVVDKITQKEFDEICGDYKYTRIEKES